MQKTGAACDGKGVDLGRYLNWNSAVGPICPLERLMRITLHWPAYDFGVCQLNRQLPFPRYCKPALSEYVSISSTGSAGEHVVLPLVMLSNAPGSLIGAPFA